MSDFNDAEQIARFFSGMSTISITNTFIKVIEDSNPMLRAVTGSPNTSYGLDIVYNKTTGGWDYDALVAVVATFVNKYADGEEERRRYINEVLTGLYIKNKEVIGSVIEGHYYIYQDLDKMITRALDEYRAKQQRKNSPFGNFGRPF